MAHLTNNDQLERIGQRIRCGVADEDMLGFNSFPRQAGQTPGRCHIIGEAGKPRAMCVGSNAAVDGLTVSSTLTRNTEVTHFMSTTFTELLDKQRIGEKLERTQATTAYSMTFLS